MGATKQMFNTYRQMQEQYLTDIDLSGGLFHEFCERQPKKELKVTVTNFGKLYKAFLDGKQIYRDELFKLLGITYLTPLRLEHHLFEFEKKNKSTYKLIFSEIDIT